MRIYHLRNVTMVIETERKVLLVDPMLGDKGTLPPFAFIRSKPRKNPTVSLPEGSKALLDSVTHAIITHRHPDHLDGAGIAFLKEKEIPVLCSVHDKEILHKQGLAIHKTFDYWEQKEFSGGYITGIPATHGYGFVTKFMGDVMGFLLELPGEPSIYLSSDTIFTNGVNQVLTEYGPDVSVVACGSAQFDIFRPLLMNMDEIIQFVRQSPGKVIANHLEAINHCPTTRKQLRNMLEEEKLQDKVFIPNDGESIELL
ncbi:MBL fold metallo-hydrolase [Aliifodinibius salicampi]|uniref:MBL fold metallo-hydrolase n=1 Tax=Fodinibius salicampi TaxID=1920655 RepID=A0ABT3PX64_9BACT|nr:MBL fold metallo-hydrolase [Fodinibius salicampi]MCW9712437.1 MBL fold metallo-hydrolase [Fodinibius salicampi]